MTRRSRPTGRQAIDAPCKAGFEEIRTRGSHHFLRHADGRCTVVPAHSGETIGAGLMAKILRETEMIAEQCTSLL